MQQNTWRRQRLNNRADHRTFMCATQPRTYVQQIQQIQQNSIQMGPDREHACCEKVFWSRNTVYSTCVAFLALKYVSPENNFQQLCFTVFENTSEQVKWCFLGLCAHTFTAQLFPRLHMLDTLAWKAIKRKMFGVHGRVALMAEAARAWAALRAACVIGRTTKLYTLPLKAALFTPQHKSTPPQQSTHITPHNQNTAHTVSNKHATMPTHQHVFEHC